MKKLIFLFVLLFALAIGFATPAFAQTESIYHRQQVRLREGVNTVVADLDSGTLRMVVRQGKLVSVESVDAAGNRRLCSKRPKNNAKEKDLALTQRT